MIIDRLQANNGSWVQVLTGIGNLGTASASSDASARLATSLRLQRRDCRIDINFGVQYGVCV